MKTKLLCVLVATIVACGVGTSFIALGQNQGAASTNDVIFARKTLMVSVATNMYPVDEMRQNGKYDLPRGRENADSISAMLMAFPHLFPPTTNTWTDKAPRDPAVDTFAAPALARLHLLLQGSPGCLQSGIRVKPCRK